MIFAYTVTSDPLLIKRSVCLPLPRTNLNSHKPNIFVLLGTTFCPSARFLNISWKSKNLNFGQLSLN